MNKAQEFLFFEQEDMRLNCVPRSRGWPAGPIGQPFYGWFADNHRFSRPLQRPFVSRVKVRPLKRPEQSDAWLTSRKTAGLLALRANRLKGGKKSSNPELNRF